MEAGGAPIVIINNKIFADYRDHAVAAEWDIQIVDYSCNMYRYRNVDHI